MARRVLVCLVTVVMLTAAATYGLLSAGPAFAAGCQPGEKLHLDLMAQNGGPGSPNVTITVTNCTTNAISYLQRSRYIAQPGASCAGTVTRLPDIRDNVAGGQSKTSNTGVLNPPCMDTYVFKTKLLNPKSHVPITKGQTTFVCCPVKDGPEHGA